MSGLNFECFYSLYFDSEKQESQYLNSIAIATASPTFVIINENGFLK